MYRLVITPLENEKFKVSSSNEYFLNSSEDVCNVLDAFTCSKFFYSLSQVFISSSDDVINEVLGSFDNE